VLGPSDDATVVPRGLFRFSLAPTWSRSNQRFADGERGTARGTVESLGHDFDLDSMGTKQFPFLLALTSPLQAITGLPSVPLSFGRLAVAYDVSSVTTPLSLEYGLTDRITVGVTVPYVKTRNEVSVNPNPARNEGTLGFNPALAFTQARAANGTVVTQLQGAAGQLQSLLAQCTGSATSACAAVNADRPRAEALVATATTVATSIAQLYGTETIAGQPFAPVAKSALQAAVDGRLGTLAADFQALLGPAAGGASWITARPIGAPLVSWRDVQVLLSDSTYGIDAVPLETVERSHIGDAEAGIKVLLLDTYGGTPQRRDAGGLHLRLAVAGIYRKGTAQVETADDFADVGTGDGTNDVEGRLFADVLLGRRFWASAVARYAVQGSVTREFRIPAYPGDPFPDAARKVMVRHQPGNFLDLEFTPRLVVTEAIALGATWRRFSQAADNYTVAAAAQGGGLDATTLSRGSARSEQRLTGSITYSTMSGYYRGQSRLPLEVTYAFGQSLSGDGNQPKQFVQTIALRYYRRLFGGDARPARAK
jgi:hypothetical protein